MKTALTTILIGLALTLAACGDDEDSASGGSDAAAKESLSAQSPAEAAKRGKPKVSVPEGAPPKRLATEDLIEGSGAAAKAGDEVTVQYVGVGYDSREEFDASWDRGEPFTFTLGAGEVIPGWDQGVAGMKVGGQRQLLVPGNLAYGQAGFPPAIGPNEALVFVVDLLSAR
ncbi:MAG TPA: FKBP-type peptidyl-prolyl cis-trans isomerase [Solirubrobacterales bacterium]|nr:FKBP-type peptidyl-prolyl cis-trans isomerase [Solirubrobacterales bacterium]